jgi:ABC-type glycerol-3-phosphate transport system substrate-binding protein
MMVDGSWELLSDWTTEATPIGSAPIPFSTAGGSSNGSIVIDGPVVFIPAHAQDQQTALNVLSWLITPEVQVQAAQAFSMLPLNIKAANHEPFQALEQLEDLIAWVSGS